jgi:hypothetical protein
MEAQWPLLRRNVDRSLPMVPESRRNSDKTFLYQASSLMNKPVNEQSSLAATAGLCTDNKRTIADVLPNSGGFPLPRINLPPQ